MATEHILSLLIAERDKLNKAIEALGGVQPPVRPPAKTLEPVVARRKRKALTPAQKRAHSERMKAYWAARRKKKS